jgi:hypothetical protein
MHDGGWDPQAALRALIEMRYAQGNGRAWRQQTPQLTQALRALSHAQARELARELWARPDREALTPFLGQLHTTVPGALTDLWDALVAQQVLLPSWLYRGAPRTTTQHLLRLLDDPAAQEQRNLLLLALAWVDDALVQTRFHAWRASPPDWRADVYRAPEEYAPDAGWELTPDGGRRQLYRSTCYELIPVDEPEDTPSAQAVAVSTPHEASCGWCGRGLVTLLDIDLGDPRCAFVVGEEVISGATRLRIAYCWWCSTYAPLYTDINLVGGSVWSAVHDDKPRSLEWIGNGAGEEMPEPALRRLALGALCRTPFEAVGRFGLDETGVSQIGGHPEWIQDLAYPTCPSCQRRMERIGQVSWEDLDEFAEGCTYAFLCLPCGKAATTYQQT